MYAGSSVAPAVRSLLPGNSTLCSTTRLGLVNCAQRNQSNTATSEALLPILWPAIFAQRGKPPKTISGNIDKNATVFQGGGGVEVIFQHPQGGFGFLGFAAQLRAVLGLHGFLKLELVEHRTLAVGLLRDRAGGRGERISFEVELERSGFGGHERGHGNWAERVGRQVIKRPEFTCALSPAAGCSSHSAGSRG